MEPDLRSLLGDRKPYLHAATTAVIGRRSLKLETTTWEIFLHARAQDGLGAEYDLRAFDVAFVLGGNVPLDLLAKADDEHIERAKSS